MKVKEEWDLLTWSSFENNSISVFEFRSVMFPAVIDIRIKASSEDRAWEILSETVK